MPDDVRRVTDMISAPMEVVIVALGTGIARAQREMDRFAIESQREIDQDPVLSEHGLQATFYQIPRAELELTVAIALEERSNASQAVAATSATTGAATLQLARLKQLHLQPVNAAYTNQFNYDVNASSKLKLTIVPVPPPAGDAAVTPRLTNDEVVAIARPQLVTETDGVTLPKDARLSVNFNGQARLWFVLEYRVEGDTVRRLALVVVDDDTRQIVKAQKGS